MSSTPFPQQALGWARRFSPRQMVAAGVLVAIVLGGSFGLVSWLSRPDYAVLYTGLTATDAGAITAKLDGDGTPYQLDAGGSTVLVPREVVPQTRLAMATANLPAESVVGYELMDKQSITTDSATQAINHQRALEGEITKTLLSLEGVYEAKVRLVMPQERLFTDQETPARAAVVLKSRRAMTDETVNAVTHLVASSVPNLDPSNVTITDRNARLLAGGGAGAAGSTGDQRKIQAAYEQTLEERAASLLAKAVGEGNAEVRVNATMDFTQRTRATEEYDPKKSAAKETSSTKEQYTTTTKQPGGTLTTVPNQTAPTTTTEQNYLKSADAQALNNTKTITQEVEAPGAVTRLTVSVLLNNKADSGMSAEEIQAQVGNAIGVNTTRGDTVVVNEAAFDDSADTASAAAAKQLAEQAKAEQQTKLMIAGGAGALILIAIIILAVLALRSRKKPIDPALLAQASAAQAAAAVPDMPSVPDTRSRLPLSAPDRADEAKEVLDRVDQRPQDAARVLRGLMADDSVQSGKGK